MRLLAHRGASAEAPENTAAALRLAWTLGVGGAEIDVRLTRDGEVVLMHDARLDRTTNGDGALSGYAWEELRPFDAGAWKGDRWRGEPVPRLVDILRERPAGFDLYIELKEGGALPARLAGVLGPKPADVTLLCFGIDVLRAARILLPSVPACWNLEPPDRPDAAWVAARTDEVRRAGFDGLSLGWTPAWTADILAPARASGLRMAVWTVDDPEQALQARAAGFDVLMSNDPRRLRNVL